MSRPRALDLFCGAGGATRGLQMAGFHVTGVDIEGQSNYCGDFFLQGDAMRLLANGDILPGAFDFIWASPPCQRYSMYSRNTGTSGNHPDLIAPTRAALMRIGGLWAIENVEGAPLRDPVVLCGTMFGLKLLRHRLFETSFTVAALVPPCNHKGDEIPVYGNGAPQWHRERLGRGVSIDEKRAAMGIDWMNRDELSQTIPPAYSEFIGRHALRHIAARPQEAARAE